MDYAQTEPCTLPASSTFHLHLRDEVQPRPHHPLIETPRLGLCLSDGDFLPDADNRGCWPVA